MFPSHLASNTQTEKAVCQIRGKCNFMGGRTNPDLNADRATGASSQWYLSSGFEMTVLASHRPLLALFHILLLFFIFGASTPSLANVSFVSCIFICIIIAFVENPFFAFVHLHTKQIHFPNGKTLNLHGYHLHSNWIVWSTRRSLRFAHGNVGVILACSMFVNVHASLRWWCIRLPRLGSTRSAVFLAARSDMNTS